MDNSITRTKLEMKTGALHVNVSDFDGSGHAGFHASRREAEVDVHHYPRKADEFIGMREEYFTIEVRSNKGVNQPDSSVALYLSRDQIEEIVAKAGDILNENPKRS